MELTKEKIIQLQSPLPEWALRQHPSKSYLTVINPMAVIDRLNEVFGIGQWQTRTEPVNFVGKFAVVKVTLTIPKYDIHIEQYGGNDNTDCGDAYKGASTDALTKIASYLGIGASIYKGQGNTAPKIPEGVGLNTKEFAQARDNYANNNVIKIEDWENMNAEQRKIINQIKLTKKNAKN
jgi:hypothetical protein